MCSVLRYIDSHLILSVCVRVWSGLHYICEDRSDLYSCEDISGCSWQWNKPILLFILSP